MKKAFLWRLDHPNRTKIGFIRANWLILYLPAYTAETEKNIISYYVTNFQGIKLKLHGHVQRDVENEIKIFWKCFENKNFWVLFSDVRMNNHSARTDFSQMSNEFHNLWPE